MAKQSLVGQTKNAMTVDVEDYFHVSAFENVISKDEWSSITPRVGTNTHKLLDVFAQHDAKATFFCLGWVAKHCPDVIKRIVDEGHELASHGSNHKRLTTMARTEVLEDIRASKDILEQVSGKPVNGYRAPSFSINENNEWVFELLVELGFLYSSSTYPIAHDLYGVPSWPRFKYERPEGIVEIPVPTLKAGASNKGIGGGGFFRLYPYWLSKRRIQAFLKSECQPYSFYFHPWEIDPSQPRVKNAPFKSKLRHYINLSKMEAKLVSLLNDFNWDTMSNTFQIDNTTITRK